MEENFIHSTDLNEGIYKQHLNMFHSLPEEERKKEIENEKELVLENEKEPVIENEKELVIKNEKELVIKNEEEKSIINEEINIEEKPFPLGDFSIWNAEECFPLEDTYCTLRLPKCIGINSHIKKKNNEEVPELNSSDTDGDFGERKCTYINWSFDEQGYLENMKKKKMTQCNENTCLLENEEEKRVEENECIKSQLDKLYSKYENVNSEIFNNISEECHDNVKAICNNLKYFETNTFLVEYENGEYVLFIDNKPFLLEEEEEESNYLIGNPQETIKPILCHLKSNLNAKGMSMDDQPSAPKIEMKEDIFYLLP